MKNFMPLTLTAFEESSKYVGQTKLQMRKEPVPVQSQMKSREDGLDQGTNARKVISEVYAIFVLQCTVFRRKSKSKTDVTAWHGINFHKNNL